MDIEYFRETFHLSLNSTTTLYQQLYDYFKRLILTGIIKEGDQMIPEIAICEELNVSRSTVRKAMDMLIEDGLLMRRRGKGSFVTDRKLKRNINYLYNFTENMNSIGAIPSSIVIKAEVIDIPDDIVIEKLQMSGKRKAVFYLERIRLANGEPILHEKTYIPYILCPGIENNDFEQTTLYKVLEEQYLLKPYHATESIEAVFLNPTDKKLLKCIDNVPGFKISRVSNIENGEIFEYTTSITRSDKCEFVMELYKNSSSSNPVQIQRNISL